MNASFFDSALSHTRRSDASEKKEKKIACPLLDVFACGQVSSPRLYRLNKNKHLNIVSSEEGSSFERGNASPQSKSFRDRWDSLSGTLRFGSSTYPNIFHMLSHMITNIKELYSNQSSKSVNFFAD